MKKHVVIVQEVDVVNSPESPMIYAKFEFFSDDEYAEAIKEELLEAYYNSIAPKPLKAHEVIMDSEDSVIRKF